MTAHFQWMADAACLDHQSLPWTMDAHHLPDRTVARMRAVCAACPVLAECDSATTELKVTGGFWAGHDRNPARADAASGLIPTTAARLVHSTQLVLDIRV